jgi:uncharacterized membrane protein (UPF0127 family)
MRALVAVLVLLLASLLFVAGCGGEQKGESPSGSAPETTASAPDDSDTVALIPSGGGERVELSVEIADDPAEQQRGLMERTELAENAGMLFVFEQEQQRSFWMKDTLIPLSIAYIDSGGRIIDIQDMEPLDTTPHPSAEPAQYALEVNQGFYEEHGIEVGDTAELPG